MRNFLSSNLNFLIPVNSFFEKHNNHNLENVTGAAILNESLEESLQTSFIRYNLVWKKNIVDLCFHFCRIFVGLSNKTEIGHFHTLMSNQASYLFTINSSIISLAGVQNSEDVIAEINQLIRKRNANPERRPKKTPTENNKFLFPTPKTCTDINVFITVAAGNLLTNSKYPSNWKTDTSGSTKDIETCWDNLVGKTCPDWQPRNRK